MGFTYVEGLLHNPADLAKSEAVEVLVDSGAIFTSVPRDVLHRLEIRPIARRKLRVYGGATVERDIGVAVLEYEGKYAGITVIFGEAEDTPILGATALESLGYQLDPITKKLKPVELLML